ncbi:MAG: type II toxin-antitoxin system VapC family toxin [Gammaproteobacteria bacterium]|nr:type II toxin-antitoxin system VapC family toxin [Gammaproteobacteria bacterium]
MVIDTSALTAILQQEPEAELFIRLISDADKRLVSAVSVAEASIVRGNRSGNGAKQELDDLLQVLSIGMETFDPVQAQLAFDAWLRFGKGRHPAKLNMGDCCSYAFAKFTGEPLLFKGEDFDKTDLSLVAW